MKKRIYMLATSEVQDDAAVTDAELVSDLSTAEKMAREFMRDSVGAFLDIPAGETENAERALQKRLSVETSVTGKLFTERYSYRCDGLCVTATIQEDEVEESI